MPANLSPEYYEAEERYRSAKSVEEKVAALDDMLRLIPKHKGTDKLQGEIKARLAKLRRQPQKKGAKGFSRHIPKQGAGQVLLVGPPNGGKSTLVAELTHANPEVAPYPFTTRDATPAMMPFKDIAFQLIDLPPLSEEHVEPWVYDLIRVCDLVWLVVDSANSLDGIELSRRLLSAKHLELFPADREPPDEQPRWSASIWTTRIWRQTSSVGPTTLTVEAGMMITATVRTWVGSSRHLITALEY